MSDVTFEDVHEFWSKFNLHGLQSDLKCKISKLAKYKTEYDELNAKFADLNFNKEMILVLSSKEKDTTKTAPFAKLLKQQVGNVLERYKTSAKICANLFQIINNMPHPFPLIEKLITQNYSNDIELHSYKKKLAEAREQIHASELKLKSAEYEIQGYKQIVEQYENEINEFKKSKEIQINGEKSNDATLKSDQIESDLTRSIYDLLSIGSSQNLYSKNNDDNDDDESPPMSSQSSVFSNQSECSSINSTEYLDTEEVVRKLRSVLSTNNITNRAYAKFYLGLSESCFYRLISKPLNWQDLKTNKIRGYYKRMHEWASNEANVQSFLKSCHQEMEEENKRRSILQPTKSATLDTQVVVDKVNAMRNEHNIEIWALARFVVCEVKYMSEEQLHKVLTRPAKWTSLKSDGKDVFRVLHEWSMNEEKVREVLSVQNAYEKTKVSLEPQQKLNTKLFN